MNRETLAIGIGILIAVLYAAAFTTDILVSTYDIPKELHGLMGLVGAWLFGVGVVRTNGKRNGG